MQKIEYNNKAGYFYEYFRPGVTCDVIIYKTQPLDTSVLLSKRNQEPFRDYYCNAGGFLEEGETAKMCAVRELREETGLICQNKDLTFFSYYDLIDDPRGQSLNLFFTCPSHVFEGQSFKITNETSEIKWVKLEDLNKYKVIDHHTKMIRKFFGET